MQPRKISQFYLARDSWSFSLGLRIRTPKLECVAEEYRYIWVKMAGGAVRPFLSGDFSIWKWGKHHFAKLVV